jgi:hypothetical protein
MLGMMRVWPGWLTHVVKPDQLLPPLAPRMCRLLPCSVMSCFGHQALLCIVCCSHQAADELYAVATWRVACLGEAAWHYSMLCCCVQQQQQLHGGMRGQPFSLPFLGRAPTVCLHSPVAGSSIAPQHIITTNLTHVVPYVCNGTAGITACCGLYHCSS